MYARHLPIAIASFPSLLALTNIVSPPYIVSAVLVTPHRTPPCQPVYFTEEAEKGEEAEEEKEKQIKKFEKESTRKNG